MVADEMRHVFLESSIRRGHVVAQDAHPESYLIASGNIEMTLIYASHALDSAAACRKLVPRESEIKPCDKCAGGNSTHKDGSMQPIESSSHVKDCRCHAAKKVGSA